MAPVWPFAVGGVVLVAIAAVAVLVYGRILRARYREMPGRCDNCGAEGPLVDINPRGHADVSGSRVCVTCDPRRIEVDGDLDTDYESRRGKYR